MEEWWLEELPDPGDFSPSTHPLTGRPWVKTLGRGHYVPPVSEEVSAQGSPKAREVPTDLFVSWSTQRSGIFDPTMREEIRELVDQEGGL